jgi:predicted aspartyl protease
MIAPAAVMIDIDDGNLMGTFQTSITVCHLNDRSSAAEIADMLVDTGSEATWIRRTTLEGLPVPIVPVKSRTFSTADGRHITRPVGYALIKCDPGFETVDEVVFAEHGDLQLLGARTLEGFNANVDATNKCLVAAGPMVAAGNVQRNSEI